MRHTILMIDDEKLIQFATKIIYESMGLDVLTAMSGEAGLELAARHQPSLILLDILMPGMDGWETLARLKEDEALRDIPVVILTPSEHSRGRELAREHGAVDYFPKPFEPDELISVIFDNLGEGKP